MSLRPLTLANSYIEGIVRGYRNALLTSQNYNNLTQCETIDGPSSCPLHFFSSDTPCRCQASALPRVR